MKGDNYCNKKFGGQQLEPNNIITYIPTGAGPRRETMWCLKEF